VSGHSLNEVAKVLGQVLDRRVSIHSIDGGVLGSHVPEGADASVSPEGVAAAFGAMKDSGRAARVDGASHPVRLGLSARRAKRPEHLVAYAARVRAERVGYVLVVEGESPLTALDLRAVEHAGTVAALQISHQRELSMQEARLGYALVASLIEGRFEDKPQAHERARLLGWNSAARYRLCTVLLDEPNPLSRDGFARREQLAARASLSLERREVRPLMSLSANQVHILVPDELNVDAWWPELQPNRMAMAVSQVHAGVEGMRIAGRETAELIEHLKPGRVHRFEQMLFPRVLSGDADAQRAFVARLFGSLDEGKRGRHLLETALALTEEGFHLQRAAERSSVHISTLRYRLGRLAELTGLDLDSVEGRFRLQLGARLYLMKEQ
jgi:purine catabolism regulator